MLKSARLLIRNNLITMVGMMGFLVACSLVVLAAGPTQTHSIFATYTGMGTMMSAILLMVLGTQLTSYLLNLGLSMGATRRGMWGAIQLNLLGAMGLCLLTQAWLDWVTSRVELRFSLSLPVNLTTGPLLVAALLLVGNLGVLFGLVKRIWLRAVLMIADMAVVTGACIAGGLVSRLSAQSGWLLWATLGCSVAVAGCAFLVYLRLRKAQINGM